MQKLQPEATVSDAFQNKVSVVRNRFAHSLPKQINFLDERFEKILNGTGGVTHLADIRGAAHKIRGVAPTLGFSDLGTQAAVVEDNIRDLDQPDKDVEQRAVAILKSIRSLLAEMARVAEAPV